MSLPRSISKLQTLSVSLTRTTEDEIYTHLTRQVDVFQQRVKDFTARFSDVLDTSNPYTHKSFRRTHRLPSRKYTDILALIEDETEMEQYHWIFKIYKDYKLAVSVFKWNETEGERATDCNEFLHDGEQAVEYMRSLEREIYQTDRNNWEDAKSAWDAKNGDLIQRDAWEHTHTTLHCPNAYSDKMRHNPECPICVAQKTEQDLAEAKQMEMELAQKQEEAKEVAQKQVEKQVLDETPVSCEICMWSGCGTHTLHKHNHSEDHATKVRLTSLFCKACKTQCACSANWVAHINTEKHKIAISTYCVVCDKTFSNKQNYTKHCKNTHPE